MALRSSRPASPAESRKLRERCLRPLCGVANDADGDFLGQADAVGVDIDLNDLGVGGPVIHAIARQRRERVEPGAKARDDVGVLDQLHPAFEPL